MSKNKRNPARQLRESDIRRIKKQTTDDAIKYALVIFFSVMRDNEGYGVKRLKRIYDGINYLSDSISKGYVKIDDLEKVLWEEANIKMS